MLERFRALSHTVLGPVARLLIRLGVSPDVVTVIGTLGVAVAALVCFPQGWLWQGALVVTLFVISDMIDGLMAKISGTSSNWGAFLDSTSDRLGDAAVFGGILLYFVYREASTLWAGIALAGLVFGQWTSYVKARAESLGFTCSGGLAARADRLVIILAGALLAGLGVPYVLQVAVAGLAVTSMITVVQRIDQVRRQAKAADVRTSLTGWRRLAGRLRNGALRRLFRLGWRTAHRIPAPIVSAALAVAARLAVRFPGGHVQMLRRNLALTTGRPVDDRLLRAAVRSHLRNVYEMLALPGWPPEQVLRRIETVNEPQMRAAYAEHRRRGRAPAQRQLGPGRGVRAAHRDAGDHGGRGPARPRLRGVRRLPRAARHAGAVPPGPGGDRRAARRRPRRPAGLPARGPGPGRLRAPGALGRAAGHHAGRPGAGGPAVGRGPDPDRLPVHPARDADRVQRPDPAPAGPGRAGGHDPGRGRLLRRHHGRGSRRTGT